MQPSFSVFLPTPFVPYKQITVLLFGVLLLMGASTAALGQTSRRQGGNAISASSSGPSLQHFDTLAIADPTIYGYQGKYYLYGTSGDKTVGAGFKGFVADDLKGNEQWHRIHSVKEPGYLVLDSAHSFGHKGFWAPQILSLKTMTGLLMAYTANEQIALARSTKGPKGPFTQDLPFTTLFKDGFKHIDPFIFSDPVSRKTFIYYVKLDKGNKIFVSELSVPAYNEIAVLPATEKLCLMATASWENTTNVDWPVTEGPTVIYHNGYYYLFYSANDFRNPDYAVGYATAKSPMGPWVKAAENPILSRHTIALSGVGHGDVIRDKKGDFYYVFHAHQSLKKVSPRHTFLIRFRFYPNKMANGGSGEVAGPDKIQMDYKSVKPLLIQVQSQGKGQAEE